MPDHRHIANPMSIWVCASRASRLLALQYPAPLLVLMAVNLVAGVAFLQDLQCGVSGR